MGTRKIASVFPTRFRLFLSVCLALGLTQTLRAQAQLDCGSDAIAGEVCIPSAPVDPPKPDPPKPDPPKPDPPKPDPPKPDPPKPDPADPDSTDSSKTKPIKKSEAQGAAGPVVPLAVFQSWSSFSRLLLEPLPQKVPVDRIDLIAPGPEADNDPPFRFASVPGAYYSERNGWRLQIFGMGGGGKLLPGNDDFGSTSIRSSFNLGLKLDVAVDDNSRIGVFGRFAEQNLHMAARNDFHSGRATSQQIGGGLFAQVEKPDWFARAAIGWDDIDGRTPLQVRNDPDHGDFRTGINRSGSAFNAALHGGLRWSLNNHHLLEPSVRLSGTWMNVSGGSRHGYRIGNTSTGLGALDLGVSWKAPIRDGSNLFTPSLRVSWLHRDFLGATPGSNITVQGGPDIERSSPEIETNGLGLQGELAYTFKDNTAVVLHGGANFYGSDPIWNVGGRLQLRF